MTKTYTPPKVWKWEGQKQGRFTSINRPIAGATHDKELPVGKHPLQLYSLGTPNGVKVTVMLEELLALGHGGRRIRRLADQDQPMATSSARGFVADRIPNSKIPALMPTIAGPIHRSASSNPARS